MRVTYWGLFSFKLVHGVLYKQWGAWRTGDCPSGFEIRNRECLFENSDCLSEDLIERRECAYSAWTNWGKCTNVCGYGKQKRERTSRRDNKVKYHEENKQCFECESPCSHPDCGINQTPKSAKPTEFRGLPGVSTTPNPTDAIPAENKKPKNYDDIEQKMASLEQKIKDLERQNEQLATKDALRKVESILQTVMINGRTTKEVAQGVRNNKKEIQKLQARESHIFSRLDEYTSSSSYPNSQQAGDLEELRSMQSDLTEKVELIHDNLKDTCSLESKKLIDVAMESRDDRIIKNAKSLAIVKIRHDNLVDVFQSSVNTVNQTLATIPNKIKAQLDTKLRPIHRKIRNLVNHEIKRKTTNAPTVNSLDYSKEIGTINKKFYNMNLTLETVRQDFVQTLTDFNRLGAEVKQSRRKALEKRIQRMADMSRKKGDILRGHITRLNNITSFITIQKETNANLSGRIDELKKEIIENNTTKTTTLQPNPTTDVVNPTSNDKFIFHYTLESKTGRKMGQKPHPFLVPMIDETKGSYMTTGNDCYAVGGKKRNGKCAGVFRAQRAGVYQFMLHAHQMPLKNGRPQLFTGWIKLNGKAFTGGYSTAYGLKYAADGRLNTISTQAIIKLKPGDEVSTLFVKYAGEDTLATGPKYTFFSGYCIRC